VRELEPNVPVAHSPTHPTAPQKRLRWQTGELNMEI
jgi:hypothetical protein